MNLHDVADEYEQALRVAEAIGVIQSKAAALLFALELDGPKLPNSYPLLVIAEAMIQILYPDGVPAMEVNKLQAITWSNLSEHPKNLSVLFVMGQVIAECLSDEAYNALASDAFHDLTK